MSKELHEMTLEELWELFPIILDEHNESFSIWYTQERKNIMSQLPDKTVQRISHIGSSAVKGLLSKPTVDILLEISEDTDLEVLESVLSDIGFEKMSSQREPHLNDSYCKGYTKHGFAEKVFHLHARYKGDWSELYFRDYLIEHENVAIEYAELKKKLSVEFKHHRDNYTHAKSDFVTKYSEIARELYKGRYSE